MKPAAILSSPLPVVASPAGVASEALGVPRWVEGHLGPVRRVSDLVSLRCGEVFTLASAEYPRAGGLSDVETRAGARELFESLFAAISSRHAVRIWSFIPGINDRFGDSHDRYMAFNAGRHDAMVAHFGSGGALAARVPAATGVGHIGDGLSVHMLACAMPGTHIESPLQRPAYQYSARYGPLPPCFARATRIALPERLLLVSGTAAIRGEDTQHVHSAGDQLRLTLENLSALLNADVPVRAGERILERFQNIRAYVPKPGSFRDLQDTLAEAFPVADIEIVTTELCRPELAIEIEGAAISPGL